MLANYALALGLLVPMAVLQGICAFGFPDLFTGQAGLCALLAAGNGQDPYWFAAHMAAAPSLLALWLLLAVGHLRLAWALVDRDWARVVRIGALMTAITATLGIFMTVLLLDSTPVAREAAALAVELAAILVVARWHHRLWRDAPAGEPAWHF